MHVAHTLCQNRTLRRTHSVSAVQGVGHMLCQYQTWRSTTGQRVGHTKQAFKDSAAASASPSLRSAAAKAWYQHSQSQYQHSVSVPAQPVSVPAQPT
eukprot:1260157-Rhodomonas_salina.1